MRSRSSAILPFLAVTLALAGPALGQESQEGARGDNTGHIIGQLRDASTGQPIASARVTLSGLDHRTLTDVNGRFDLAFVPAGSHMLQFQHIGFGVQRAEVTVPAGEAIGVEVELKPEAIEVAPLTVSIQTLNPDLMGTGFYRRKYANRGGFFGEEEFLNAPVRQSLPVLEAIPQMGPVVLRLGMGPARRCAPILVDGRPYTAGYVTDYSHDFSGIEIYGPHEAPTDLYQGVSMYEGLAQSRRRSASGQGQVVKQESIERCGLILLWTDSDSR